VGGRTYDPRVPLRSDFVLPPPNALPDLDGLALHVLGVRGRGMQPLALAAAAAGADVDGCDRHPGEDDAFASAGIRVVEGHDAAHVGHRRLVVTSTARPDEPEIERARSLGVLHHRSELLNAVLRGRQSIAVTGTHGKGTVSALTGLALEALGRDPLVVLGLRVPALGGPFRAGDGPAVAEADDADGTIARVESTVSVVTNSWFDHSNLGRTRTEVITSVAEHVARVPASGRVVLGRGRNLAPAARAARAPVWRLGRDFDVETVDVDAGGRRLRVHDVDGETVETTLRLHGGNVADNAGLAFAALRAVGVCPEAAAAGLSALTALERRMELVAEVEGVRVFDDLGKHPEAVAATLAAVRELRPERVHAVYEPMVHDDVLRWQRRWARAFSAADSVVVLPVDDRPVLPVTRRAPFDWPHRVGMAADLASSRDDAVDMVVARCTPGDVVVVLGNIDDLDEVSRDIAARLVEAGV
jgi:UDP-N-acetylmuramate--alanine ligase